MLTEPADIPAELLARELAAGWGVEPTALGYLPVGFGSHHWTATTAHGPLFVTVDRGGERLAPLAAALGTARRLADTGFLGAVAPRPTRTGDVVRFAATGSGDRFAISVTDWVEGTTYADVDRRDPDEVVALLADLHDRIDDVRGVALPESWAVPHRAALERRLGALAATEPAGASGPFGEPARALLHANRDLVTVGLAAYDRLCAGIPRDGWVITHGEPHERNLLLIDDGGIRRLVLVDWDTCRVGPAARDLWDAGAATIERYVAATGRAVADDEVALFRLRWELMEVAEYVDAFAQPHEVTDDTTASFGYLAESLEKLRRLLA